MISNLKSLISLQIMKKSPNNEYSDMSSMLCKKSDYVHNLNSLIILH